jgi:hypothetical protein
MSETIIPLQKDWEKLWTDMPSFTQKDLHSWQKLIVHFASTKDREDFAKLIGQKGMTHKTRSIWFPPAPIGHFAGKSYESMHRHINPRYPVYIISKGRWKSRKTARALDKLNIPYHIVVEPQEYDQYAAVIDPKKIKVLPKEGYGKGCSIPARNWVWKDSIKRGAERHWILDDNIEGFFRLHKNLKTPVADGAIFRAAEDFSDRFTNVGISGFNYFMFAPRKSGDIKPFTLNTRIYSCILIRNDLKWTEEKEKVDLRWRGRYNEDTDLSIRALKEGYCTVLFNAFLAFKSTTMTMKGGNTDSLYQGDGRKDMAMSLKEQHPDLVTVTRKWDRWQHHVDYSGFVQKLQLKPDYEQEKIDNNYGMMLKVKGKKK